MTIQKRTLISPQDIIGIEYECKHCHARYVVTMKQIGETVFHCPNCKCIWVRSDTPTTSNYSEEKVMRIFGEFLRELQDRPMGAIIRLELAEPPVYEDVAKIKP